MQRASNICYDEVSPTVMPQKLPHCIVGLVENTPQLRHTGVTFQLERGQLPIGLIISSLSHLLGQLDVSMNARVKESRRASMLNPVKSRVAPSITRGFSLKPRTTTYVMLIDRVQVYNLSQAVRGGPLILLQYLDMSDMDMLTLAQQLHIW
jgi:hypothetical protein